MPSYLLLFFAALVGGFLNSVAGGGMFIIFPALVFTGVPSIIANASASLAVIPGILTSAWAYRRDFRNAEFYFPFAWMVAVSIAGAIIGALLLLLTPQRTFDFVIPWLLLLATFLFTFGLRIAPWLKRRFQIGPITVVVVQFFIAIYGGYFGGGIGIMMMATWTLFGITNMLMMNANRTLLGAAANAVAVVLFIAAHKIWWPQTLVMLIGTVIGGYAGAHWVLRTHPKVLRACVSVISVGITIAFFLRKH